MKIIKTADWHLDTAVLNSYRWEFMEWLIRYCKKNKVDRVDILGDLTVKKDNHPSKLVNKMVDIISRLSEVCSEGVYILKGNHDYIDEQHSFFAFVDRLPKVKFIQVPFILGKELFLPHTYNPNGDWLLFKFNDYHTINMHQCFIGSVSNGHEMDKGADIDLLKGFKGTVFSGDIHTRQVIKNLVYIGAPYHINFGDGYQGRIIVIDNGRDQSLNVDHIMKLSLTVSSEKEIEKLFKDSAKGDQAKVVVRLHQSEMHEYKKLRDMVRKKAEKYGIVLCGIKCEKIKEQVTMVVKRDKKLVHLDNVPRLVFDKFCQHEKMGKEAVAVGIEIMDRLEAIRQ